MYENRLYKAGLTVGILSIVCGIIISLSGLILGTVGIVINVKERKEKHTTAGFVLSLIGLIISTILYTIKFILLIKHAL